MRTMTLALAAVLALAQDADEAKKIDDLIKQLGADEYTVREKATEELKKIGKPAEEALKKAAASEDPEVRTRAQSILKERSAAEKPKSEEAPQRAPERRMPGFGFRGFGGRGSSVQVMSVNGDATYKITPADGSPITFTKSASGAVKLDYTDEKGASKTAESESVEKFLADHKELAEQHGITKDGIDYGGAKVSFQGNPLGLRGIVPPGGFRFRADADENDLRTEMRASGATFEKVSEALRSQLGLPEGEGLVVKDVASGAFSPAGDAGLKKNDILLEIDGKKVTSIKDVKETFKKTSSVTVLRKGKKETLGARKDY